MKICPLMAFNADKENFVKVYDYSPAQLQEIKEYGAVKITSNQPSHLEVVGCECKESDCAWWSEERKCCGVVRQ